MRTPIHEFAFDMLLLIGLILVMWFSIGDGRRITRLEQTIIQMKQASEIE